MERVRWLMLTLLAAAGLAACGGSGPTTATRTVTVTTPSTSATTTSTPASTTALSTTTSASTGTPPCRAADLTLSFLGQQGAAGHGLLGFTLRNTSSSSCHTFGYPGVLFLGRSGRPLATIPHHTTRDYFGPAPEVELTLRPGARVSFRLGVTHGAVPGSVCANAYGLQVIPPDDTVSIRTTIPGGAYECRDASVSPLERGTSAYP